MKFLFKLAFAPPGEGQAPLARTHSLSSGIGYHTPVEDDEDDEDEDDEVQESMFVEGEGLSEIPTDFPGASVSRGGSFVNTTQAPSPSSAIMTVSLDAYLDPQRISYGSPADFEMVPRISSPDDTFPVFSPPPFDVKILENSFRLDNSSPNLANQDRDQKALDQNMLVPPNANGGGSSSGSSVAGGAPQPSRRHRRLSSLNTVSWPNPNELTVSPRPPRRMSTVAGSETGVQEEDDVTCATRKLVVA